MSAWCGLSFCQSVSQSVLVLLGPISQHTQEAAPRRPPHRHHSAWDNEQQHMTNQALTHHHHHCCTSSSSSSQASRACRSSSCCCCPCMLWVTPPSHTTTDQPLRQKERTHTRAESSHPSTTGTQPHALPINDPPTNTVSQSVSHGTVHVVQWSIHTYIAQTRTLTARERERLFMATRGVVVG